MCDLSKLSSVLFHHFFINKTNRSFFSNAYICMMSNTWVDGKKVPSVRSTHLLPNIRHLEILNEPNDWIFHASLKTLRSGEDRSLWIACELHGEADLYRNSVDGNVLIEEKYERDGYRLPRKLDERYCSGQSPLPQVLVRNMVPGEQTI